MVVAIVFDFHNASGAQTWTRQAPWYMPFLVKPRVLCVMNLQHACMHHFHYLAKAAQYTRYIFVPQKGSEIVLL